MANNPRRLPLWRDCYEELKSNGITYGSTITVEWFEERLLQGRDSVQFGLDIHKIRRALEYDGYYLSGRETNGQAFTVLPPAANSKMMKSYQRQALDALKRGVILGTNTRLDELTESERRKHERQLEKIAFRAALMSRAGQISEAQQKRLPSEE